MSSYFSVPGMLSPEDYPDYDPFYTRKPAKHSSITVELKAYTLLLDLFQAMYQHRTAPSSHTEQSLTSAFEKAEAFYRGE